MSCFELAQLKGGWYYDVLRMPKKKVLSELRMMQLRDIGRFRRAEREAEEAAQLAYLNQQQAAIDSIRGRGARTG